MSLPSLLLPLPLRRLLPLLLFSFELEISSSSCYAGRREEGKTRSEGEEEEGRESAVRLASPSLSRSSVVRTSGDCCCCSPACDRSVKREKRVEEGGKREEREEEGDGE